MDDSASYGALKGVAWGQPPAQIDGTTVYPVTLIVQVLCSRPHRFTSVNETVLAGVCHDLVAAAEQVAEGHAPYKLGDACGVLTSLDDIDPAAAIVDLHNRIVEANRG